MQTLETNAMPDSRPAPLDGSGEATVALAAAAEITRRRLRAVLSRPPFRLIAQARTPAALIEACDGIAPELAVLACDRRLLERAAELTTLIAAMPSSANVIVSPTNKGHCVRRALSAGVEGYVYEGDLEATLAPTLIAVRSGQVCVPRSMRSQVERPVFSFREKQVLELVARGLTNGEIAQRLYLAESTVKTHLSTSFRKLGVKSRKDAAAIVLDPDARLAHGIFTVPDAPVLPDDNGLLVPA